MLAALGVIVVLMVGGGAYLRLTHFRQTTGAPVGSTSTTTAMRARPIGIEFQPEGSITPSEITILPTSPPSPLFADANQPAYESGKGFVPDARRMLDIVSLQISLEQYRQSKGRYPASLSDLFPEFAPADENNEPLTAPPTDPVSHQPYDYQPATDRMSYRLGATMDNGASYTVMNPSG